jgi:hypothetical protein
MRAALFFVLLAGCAPAIAPLPAKRATKAKTILASGPVDRPKFHRFPFAPRDVVIDGPPPAPPEPKPVTPAAAAPAALLDLPPFVLQPNLVDKLEVRVKARWALAVDLAGQKLDEIAPYVLAPVRDARTAWLSSLNGSSPVPAAETHATLLEEFETAVAELHAKSTDAAFLAFADAETQEIVNTIAAASWDDFWKTASMGRARSMLRELLIERAAKAASMAYAVRAYRYVALIARPKP